MDFLTLFKQLTPDTRIHTAIDTFCGLVDAGTLPESEKKQVAEQIWLAIMPTAPKGKRHYRASFWGKCQERFVWKGLYGYRAESHADFLRRELKKGMPEPIFERVFFVPQPSSGTFERWYGAMPRTGK